MDDLLPDESPLPGASCHGQAKLHGAGQEIHIERQLLSLLSPHVCASPAASLPQGQPSVTHRRWVPGHRQALTCTPRPASWLCTQHTAGRLCLGPGPPAGPTPGPWPPLPLSTWTCALVPMAAHSTRSLITHYISLERVCPGGLAGPGAVHGLIFFLNRS